METIHAKLPPKIAEKLSWFAASEGVSITEALRSIVIHQVRGQKRPHIAESREITASPAQWRAWNDLAANFDVGIDDLIAKVLDGLARKHMGGGAPSQPPDQSAEGQK